MGQGMSGYAKTIAEDFIAQLAALNTASPLAVPEYNAAYDRMYIVDLENIRPPATRPARCRSSLPPWKPATSGPGGAGPGSRSPWASSFRSP